MPANSYGTLPGVPLGGAFYFVINELLKEDSITGELPNDSEISTISIEEGVRFRASFKRQKQFLEAHDRLLPLWKQKIICLFKNILEYFPDSAFIDVSEDGYADDDSVVFPKAHAYDLCENLPEVIEVIIRTFFDNDITEAHLFEIQREIFDHNLLRASGHPPDAKF